MIKNRYKTIIIKLKREHPQIKSDSLLLKEMLEHRERPAPRYQEEEKV